MMHYRMGSDSAPDRIDAIRGFLADDLAITEVLGSREMRRYSRSVASLSLLSTPTGRLREGAKYYGKRKRPDAWNGAQD